MNHKGQTAFETLFLFVIVITAAIVTLSVYESINDSTIALSIARAETTNQLAMNPENIQIDHIVLNQTGQNPTIEIYLSEMPSPLLNTATIVNKIKANTAYKTVTVTVN